MRNTFVSFCLLAPLLFWSLAVRGSDATGFTQTLPCGTPPFADGMTDMQLHLTHFPKQRARQELVVMMPSVLGPSGFTDWVDAVAKLCTASDLTSCSDAQSARVRVLNYSQRRRRISGRFEVKLRDGTIIEGTFTAEERYFDAPSSPVICE